MGQSPRRRALGGLGALALAAGGLGATLPAHAVTDEGASFPTLEPGVPERVGIDGAALAAIDDIITADLGPEAADRYTGAVVLIAKDGVIVKHDAYGHAQTYDGAEPLETPVPMTTDPVFDLASVTKVMSTTAAVMRLVDEGRLDLDAPVSQWVPAFTGGGKEAITLRHLLTHTSGLWEWQPTYLHAAGWQEAIDYVTGLDLRYGVGEGRHYSDLGFMLLGEVIRAETGQPLEEYVREAVHEPLGMDRTGYLPDTGPFAATSFGDTYEYGMVETGSPYPILEGTVEDFTGWRDRTLVGEVNDGNAAHGFQGVAGHAGLFAPALDVAVFGQMLLNGGGYGDVRLASEEIVREFTSDAVDRGQGLGFWTDRLAAVDGEDAGGVGHNGFTGTDFMVDQERGTVVVLLTNRLHPDLPNASSNPVWTAVLETVVAADEAAPDYSPVLTATPGEVQEGDVITTALAGFAPGSSVTLTYTAADGPVLGTQGVTVDDDGAFVATFTVPAGTALGELTVAALDEVGRVASVVVTVLAGDDGGPDDEGPGEGPGDDDGPGAGPGAGDGPGDGEDPAEHEGTGDDGERGDDALGRPDGGGRGSLPSTGAGTALLGIAALLAMAGVGLITLREVRPAR